MADSEAKPDPLEERVRSTVKFRHDDPPEVREAILKAAVQRDREFFQEGLTPRPST